MNLAPSVGSIIKAELVQLISQNKAIVRMNGKDVVLQFNHAVPNEASIRVRIMDIKEDVIYGKMLPQEHSARDVLRETIPTLSGSDINKALEVIRFLQVVGLAISPDNIRRMMQLKETFGDMNLALAVYIKDIPISEITELLSVYKESDLKKLLNSFEKNLMHFSKSTEDGIVLQGMLRSLDRRHVGFLENIALLFSPDYLLRLTKDQKEAFGHIKYLLSRLRKLQLDGGHQTTDTEMLIRILDLNIVKSVALEAYSADFYTLFWKENEDNDWKSMEMSIQVFGNGDVTELVLVAEFPILKTVTVKLEHVEGSGLRSVAIGTVDDKTLDLLRKSLTFEGADVMQNVVLSFFHMPEDMSSFSSKKIKKIDLTV